MRHIYLLPLLGAIIISCNNSSTTSHDKPLEVPVVNVATKSVELEHLYVTDIQALRNVEIRSKVSGFVENIYVDEGQTVKKGQLLFKISDAEFRAEIAKERAVLNSMKAEAHISELECERVRLMVEKKIISQSELELAQSKLKAVRAKVEEAESALKHAEHRLSYTLISSPFEGIIDRIPLKAGSLVSEGTLVTSVSDVSNMYAYFNISENEYLALGRKHDTDGISGNTVHLILSDGVEYDHEGEIETVVSEFNEATGSISVRARFPNPTHLLKHRATGKVRLTADAETALVVPQKAAFEVQDKNYVYVLDKDDVVRTRNFQLAGRIDQYYIIGSGLGKGDRVVYEGIQNLKEGMKVTPRPMADSTALIASF